VRISSNFLLCLVISGYLTVVAEMDSNFDDDLIMISSEEDDDIEVV